MVEFTQAMADNVYDIAKEAANIILQYYHTSEQVKVEHKADKSPVTEADTAAHDYLVAHLEPLRFPDNQTQPVISEEGVDLLQTKEKPLSYWCVDPLDGTKEFIGRTGEFSINIAFIHNKRPIFGLIYHPIEHIAYVAIEGQGAVMYSQTERTPIKTTKCEEPLNVLLSRRHGPSKINDFFANVDKKIQILRMGSALKFGLIAKGAADLFIRSSGSSEWDNAAGQCIVTEAGGRVIALETGNELEYGTSGSFRQKSFLVVGDISYPWQTLLQDW